MLNHPVRDLIQLLSEPSATAEKNDPSTFGKGQNEVALENLRKTEQVSSNNYRF